MNYDRVIIELLNRISKLEERIGQLEGIHVQEYKESASYGELKEPRTRDKTKYIFDGHTCLKNRLVLEVVKKYVSENGGITFEKLQEVFYDKLQGSFGVVRKKSEIEPQKEIRYFYKHNYVINLDDSTEVVVSNQWGKDNIKSFIILAKSLGYKIKELYDDGGIRNEY